MKKIKVDTIIFDFDSTVLRGELLEILAEIKLKRHPERTVILDQIKDITNQGMDGKISFHDSLSRRLQLLNLDESTLTQAMPKIIGLLNPEYLELIPRLSHKQLYIISGGYTNVLHPISEILQIPKVNIFAIKLNFKQGVFSHLDEHDPLIQSDGKAAVAKSIPNKGITLMVGDGMTDYQVKAAGASDHFTAYTGVVERKPVCDKADFTINNLMQLASIII